MLKITTKVTVKFIIVTEKCKINYNGNDVTSNKLLSNLSINNISQRSQNL